MSIGSWLAGWFGCDRCSAMHRRAQTAESAAAKVIRQNDHARLWRTVDMLRRWAERERYKARHWRKHYRILRDEKLASKRTVQPSSGEQEKKT